MNFFQFNNAFQKVNADRVIQDSVLLTGDKAILLNQEQLYRLSQDSDGRQLKPYSSGDYAEYKHSINPFLSTGQPDLRETGAFYDAFQVEVNSKTIKFDSTDGKTAKLERKYSSKIFGLNKYNMAYFANQHVIPKIREELRVLTGFRF